jgi:DeoR/GlpR family transcriptional regulator of sugar metabolism
MLKEDRHRLILSLLRDKGRLLSTELASDLRVSEDTIRRDLQELDDEGHLMRVHGGALSRSPGSPSFRERVAVRSEAKAAIGGAAAKLVRSGMTLFLDAGTTTLQVARCFPPGTPLTVITNSPPVAMELSLNPSIEVIQIGGRLDRQSLAVVGAEAAEQVHRYRADLLFLGTCAIHRKHGISAPDAEEAAVKRAMLTCSAGAVALVTGDKLNTLAPFVIGPTDKLTHLIVDESAAADTLHKYEKLGIEIIRA